MKHLKSSLAIAAFATLLLLALGQPAPAAAACSYLCNGSFCDYDPDHPQWGCIQVTGSCLDEQCGAPAFAAGEAEAIVAAAEIGDLELAQRLAAGHPTLRIFTAKGLIYNGPQLAGIAGPEATAEGEIRVACADRAEVTPATAAEPPAEIANVVDPK